MDVVKTVGTDRRTRESVARMLLEHGPVTAAQIAEALGLGPAAVRRHLDALLTDGQASYRAAPRRGPRGRGRPAKLFLLTAAGRARFEHTYDDLAVAALHFLSERDGEQAVRSFAERRVIDLVDRHRANVVAAADPVARAQALAVALTSAGYAASVEYVGAGAQLCQHHCPVSHVAAEFPQLCEAETAAFADLLGVHVQRLATIARGDAVCTTHVPEARAPHGAQTTVPTTVPQPVVSQSVVSQPVSHHQPGTTKPDGGVSA